ncbi:pyridoxal 4-dehydrogenase [Abditibacteriota bacterium]|nr:pyridoxal 4-dehydrogenase [Abditibacteriota bacterium]
MELRTLGTTGLRVSALSLGASPFGGVFGDVGYEGCKRCLDTALDLGINLIDCSPYYGLTKAETMLGRTLQGVPREKYILATKVGRYGADAPNFDFSAGRVTKSVDESLSRLGVDYVDLIQCHDIEFGDLNQIVEETLPALRAVVQGGKARFVGITGLPLQVFREVIARAEVDTILSYCRYSLNDTALESLIPVLQEKGTGIISASPLSMGLLTQRGAPDWHPAPEEIKTACRLAAQHCQSKGASLEKLAVQFAVANPNIATTLVGTSKAENIASNVKWLNEPLDEELLREVEAILAPIKDQTWPSGRPENND